MVQTFLDVLKTRLVYFLTDSSKGFNQRDKNNKSIPYTCLSISARGEKKWIYSDLV